MAGLFSTGDYNRAGAGIAKNSAPKGSLKLFFEILGVRVWKLFALNVIYVIACLPIITIGPATAAMTKVLRNYAIDKNSFIWLDFKEGFIKNFKNGLIAGIIDIIGFGGLFCGLYIYSMLAKDQLYSSTIHYVLFFVTLSVLFAFMIMNYYVYLMIVSTDLSFKSIIKNAVALTFIAPKRNFISLAVNVGLLLIFETLILNQPQYLIIVVAAPAAFIGFTAAYCCYPVVQQYVINPYYENIGEVNPELPQANTADSDEVLFEDMGGKEKPIEPKKKSKKGKIIK